ncbi:hypothetical protein BPGQ101_19400 [Bacillus altitudinis]|nr:hypothetical protein [Bacillus aerophilus]MDR4199818.1 hypothetical protein [Bacillus altitudinis]TFW49914.1 hypothetical protein ES896_04850 [Bacillus sp. 005/A4HT-01/001]TYO54544.1 hypothetical protein FXF70_04230 [Bacillus sp. Y3]HCO80049.1 hypothetical protein [Bacillus sp. (in: firmicutes)]
MAGPIMVRCSICQKI